MTKQKFEKGEIIICVINGNSKLSLFHEYLVEDVAYNEILITNDEGDNYYYNDIRFIKKSDMREIKINKILKN